MPTILNGANEAVVELFLDGKSLDYVKEQTKKDFIVIKEQYSIKQLIEFIKTYE